MNRAAQQRKLWDVQLDILTVIDQVCKKNGLHYSLYAGTLLGAVRHKGFIPWDDDLDICMPRDEYEVFLDIWKNEDHPGYILQNKRNTPTFTQTFSKIRKDHTTFLQYEWEKGRYHTGIFVDIFPMDRCPDSFLQQALFRWRCVKYLLYTREFVPSEASAVVQVASKLFLALTSKTGRNRYRKRFEKELQELYKDYRKPIVTIETLNTMKALFPNDLFLESKCVVFEKKEYCCFAKWDEYLKLKYGDYMRMPPEKERVWKHLPLVIDFEHNYGEKSE